ncbi:hypothetical protein [Nitratifractor salsuginis]|uniref:Glycosyltransferase RgtA/B/C/D-like domain-containing protein n=1 Tax=Nitratifractor salsuginis (strain DSM 16511 / JCM 12458 / E9I37-1) TaxID=749222 RepID=E6X140_NITSE|nr:hypothetical protein [Nitratifractor salsuginis]ADV45843.1 hypothetical protein Nitsa_0575 [Nitratifractor salsuginis DSM 16511]
MIRIWRDDRVFYTFLILYALVIAALALTTPLSPSEAQLFYRQEWSPAVWAARLLHQVFLGTLGLRLVPFLLGMLNLYLFYHLLPDYFERIEDRRFTLMIFAILPGVIAANVLLNDAVFALSLTLLFLWAYRRRVFWLEALALGVLLSTATASFALYLGVALYAWAHRERALALLAGGLLILSLLGGRYLIGGHPQGHLPELFGIYAALFSPLFFVYYFYALYRVALEGPRDLYWSIAFSALALSILLSIRQQVLIVDFSPYLLAGTMIPVAVYFRSMRVRMRRFQRRYRIAGAIVLITLLLSSMAVILHRPLYELLGRPHHFFAAPLYEIPAQIEGLRSRGQSCHPPVKRRYDVLYRFYGMPACK